MHSHARYSIIFSTSGRIVYLFRSLSFDKQSAHDTHSSIWSSLVHLPRYPPYSCPHRKGCCDVSQRTRKPNWEDGEEGQSRGDRDLGRGVGWQKRQASWKRFCWVSVWRRAVVKKTKTCPIDTIESQTSSLIAKWIRY